MYRADTMALLGMCPAGSVAIKCEKLRLLNKTDKAHSTIFHEDRPDNIIGVTHSTEGRNITAIYQCCIE